MCGALRREGMGSAIQSDKHKARVWLRRRAVSWLTHCLQNAWDSRCWGAGPQQNERWTMNDERGTHGRTLTRRRTIRCGFAAGACLAVGSGMLPPGPARATPAASLEGEGVYARSEMLVDAAWLMERQGATGVVVVGFMPAEDFTGGHIPGAVQLDWPALEVVDTSDASIAAWREDAARILTQLGIGRDTTVVAYDAGTLFAARLWWILHYLGHEQKHVLNGGLAAWRQANGEVTSGMESATPPPIPGAEAYQPAPQPHALAQLDAVLTALDDPNVVIVDARTPEEYAAGHIPGAANVNYPENALPEAPKYWKPADELRAMYARAGVTPGRRVIPYCSTGVRSAVTYFTLRLIGYDDVALYTGSWKEWGSHPETPKASGTER